MKVLRVGLLGLDDVGAAYRTALLADSRFEFVAMADSNAERLRRASAEAATIAFEDCRSLIVAQTRDPIDALFVALPPHQSLDLLPLAAQRSVPVFCHAPMARTAEEARALIESFAAAKVPLVVSRRWSTGLDDDTINEIKETTGRVFAAHAVVRGTLDSADWRGDALRAGGGALLFDGYEAIDALVTLVDLPVLINAECSVAVAPGSPKKYDTEDAAAVSVRFGRDQIGSLAVCRGATEGSWSVTLIGPSGFVTLDAGRITLHRQDALEHDVIDRPPSELLATDIAAFGDALLHGESLDRLHATTRQHVRTLATIEAAYLSARTGSPESPAQFLPEHR